MPAPTTATLTGPTSGECSIVSTNFTVTLDQPAGVGGVVVTVGDTVGGDTITSSPFTIAAGNSSGTFTLTPMSCGARDISITTAPALTYAGSPKTYSATCACPDDAGGNARVQTWSTGTVVCPEAFSVAVSTTPSTIQAKDIYCSTSLLSMSITE